MPQPETSDDRTGITRPCRVAVLLAAGRGSRMREPATTARLSAEQTRWANEGLKALVPFHGWPLIAFSLSAMADAGLTDIVVVVRPGRDAVRKTIEHLALTRLRVTCAEQRVALGTADALRCAEPLLAEHDAIVVNGDNVYRAATLRRLASEPPIAMAGFRPDVIGAAHPHGERRIGAYALVRVDDAHHLAEFVEKPDAAALASIGPRAYVSMQCWRIDHHAFDACRRIARSPRGELELPDAIRAAATGSGRPVRVVPVDEDVLDLSTRDDVPIVERALAGVEVRL